MSKRQDYINWEEYFMGTASLASQRSKDPVRQVGAVIVNHRNIVLGCGYNGMPPGIDDDSGVWGKNPDDPMFNKKFLVCHAEANVLANCTECVRGCTMYVTHFPCNECAKLISINGISEVVYANFYGVKPSIDLSQISMRIFNASGIKVRKYTGRVQLVIDILE